MNHDEYKIAQRNLAKEFEAKKRTLMKEYALANNSVKVGDTVTDHYQTIRVEKIEFYISYELPGCIYYGLELKKDGKPKKKEVKSCAYQSNLKSINGKPISEN